MGLQLDAHTALLLLDDALQVWDGTYLRPSPLHDALPLPAESMAGHAEMLWFVAGGRVFQYADGLLSAVQIGETPQVRLLAASGDSRVAVMAPHLAAGGHHVTGYDISPPAVMPAGVELAADLAALAGCDTIITMLPDGDVVSAVIGALLAAGCDAMVIDMSSSHPDISRAMAADLAARGQMFVDAPVSGGVGRAESGELMIMAGGSDEAFAAVAASPEHPAKAHWEGLAALGDANLPIYLDTWDGYPWARQRFYDLLAEAGVTDALVLTVPLVLFGVLRYLHQIQLGNGGSPTNLVLADRLVEFNGHIWMAMVISFIYYDVHLGLLASSLR